LSLLQLNWKVRDARSLRPTRQVEKTLARFTAFGMTGFKFLQAMSTNLQHWVDRIRAGDVRALARAISTIEDNRSESRELLKALFNFTGRARVIGLTGAPGAGKSTLVDQLAREYRKQERTIGILAVDPTSPYTGGAILGDRIRMQSHHADAGIYIRSMATRGNLGGLARATTDAATVLDAAGKDIVLIETVGVGQDEIDIVRLADITVVILVPGMGDDVQTIKAGIMEIADIFVINKSDREGADRVEREIRSMQSLAVRSDKWTPPIVKTVAMDGRGIPELAAAIVNYEQFLEQKDLLLKKKISSWRERLIEMLRDGLLERLLNERLPEEEIARLAAEIAEHKRDPYSLVEEIVESFERPAHHGDTETRREQKVRAE
jgi:LAO/AO transport system kinase